MSTPLPKDWKSVQLSELLDDEQLKILHWLVNDIRDRKRPAKDLKDWLITLREQLESKGVLPEYLYHLLCYKFELLL